MKKGLKLLLIYFVFLLVFLIVGTLLYGLYLNILNFVAGGESSKVSGIFIANAFFFISSASLVLLCPALAYYRTRHPYGFVQTLFYILACLLTWLLFFPVIKFTKEKVYQKYDLTVESKALSKNVFRSANGHIYYFLRDFYNDRENAEDTPGIVIDTSEDGQVETASITDSADFELYTEAAPYREILIKESFPSKGVSRFLNFKLIIRRGELALDKGWTFYLGFLSLAFLLCSFYALTNFYKWKLISVAMLVVNTAAALIFNTVYFYPVFARIIFNLTNNKMFIFLNHYVDEPLLCFINFLTGLVFIVIGIVHYAVSKGKNKRGRA
jgi:hypothetical protein